MSGNNVKKVLKHSRSICDPFYLQDENCNQKVFDLKHGRKVTFGSIYLREKHIELFDKVPLRFNFINKIKLINNIIVVEIYSRL